MKHRLVTIASHLSLLLFVAAAGMWMRSYEDSRLIVWRTRGTRHAMRFEGGQIGLYCTPPPPANISQARAALATLLTQPVEWQFRRGAFGTVSIEYRLGDRVPSFHGIDAELLKALESQDTFVQAHLALAARYKTNAPKPVGDQADGACVAMIDGLRLKLWPRRSYRFDRLQPVLHIASAEIDAAQRFTLSDQWHRRLDINLGSVPFWAVASALMVLLASRATARLLRWRSFAWRAANHCPKCGYDLRFASDRCPECGAPIPSRADCGP